MLSGLTSVPSIDHPYDVRGASAVKRRIASNFSRAAESYDLAATLQKRVAARVAQLLPEELPEELPESVKGSAILDMGTGTGSQCPVLAEKYSAAAVIGMDMAMGMLEYARSQNTRQSRIHWCSGDIEFLPFADESFDLICSSLAIQWCSLEKVLSEVYRILKPGGTFVFSTLAEGSLFELDSAWCSINEPCRVNRFDSFEVQAQVVNDSYFSVSSFSKKPETLFYPELFSLLRELKSLGVNTVLSGAQGLMTRSKFHHLQSAYEQYRSVDGLPLTYQVIYGVLCKPRKDKS